MLHTINTSCLPLVHLSPIMHPVFPSLPLYLSHHFIYFSLRLSIPLFPFSCSLTFSLSLSLTHSLSLSLFFYPDFSLLSYPPGDAISTRAFVAISRKRRPCHIGQLIAPLLAQGEHTSQAAKESDKFKQRPLSYSTTKQHEPSVGVESGGRGDRVEACEALAERRESF